MSGPDAVVAKPRPERLIVAITALAGDATTRRALAKLLDEHPADVRREERQAAALDESGAWLVYHLKPCDLKCCTVHPTWKFCPYCGRTLEVAS